MIRPRLMKAVWGWALTTLLSVVFSSGLERSAFASIDVLTAEQVLESVDKNYPLVIVAIQDKEKARADLQAARGGFDPQLKASYETTPQGQYENRYFDAVLEQPTTLWGTTVFMGYRSGSGKFGPYDENLITNDRGEVRGGVDVPLLRGGVIDERRARLRGGEKGFEAMSQNLEAQKLELRRQATYRYYDWVAAGERVRVAEGLLRLARDRDEAMHQRVRTGDAAKIEQVDNERSLVQRESILVAARRAFERASLDLSLFYRDSEARPIVPTMDRLTPKGLPTPESAGVQSLDLARSQEWVERHPEVLRLRATSEQNDIDRRLANNFVLPRLDLRLSASQDYGVGSLARDVTDYKVMLRLEFPLLFRAGLGRAGAASAVQARIDAQLGLARDGLQNRLKDADQAIRASRERATLAENELVLARKVEDAERVRLSNGDSNILTVNLREQATADARIRQIDTLLEYHRAIADFVATQPPAR